MAVSTSRERFVLKPVKNVERSKNTPTISVFLQDHILSNHFIRIKNMKKGNEDPDNLGGLGGMLPAEVLKMLNGLLEQMHRAGHINRQQNRSSVCRLWRTACGDANKCGSLPHPLPKGREKGAGNLPEPLKRRVRKRLLRSTRSLGRRRMRGYRRYRTSSWVDPQVVNNVILVLLGFRFRTVRGYRHYQVVRRSADEMRVMRHRLPGGDGEDGGNDS